jgi:ADP-ribosylglycohydrolase
MEDGIRFRCQACGTHFVAQKHIPSELAELAISKEGVSYRRLAICKVDWKFSQEELARIRRPLEVRSMDDKWGSRELKDHVYFCRASFGLTIFVAHLTCDGIDELQIAQDGSWKDLRYVRWLVEAILLRREVPFPREILQQAEPRTRLAHRKARFRGALLGLAAGDALGTTLEFQPPGSFEPIWGMKGGGPFDLKPGEWTDDTSMALCLAESLTERKGFDPVDQLERYLRWYRLGRLSSNGRCFDIGNTVRAALHRFEETREPYCGSEDPRSAGNGSIMRLAPVAMAFHRRSWMALDYSADSSRTTHGAREAVDGCRYLGALLVGALSGVPKDELLSTRYTPVPDYWDENPLAPAIDEIACGSFKSRQPPEIQGSGYVVRSLEAALWAFSRSGSFKEGCLSAVNLGDDADTTGAVYGQLAGAFYGEHEIPEGWRDLLAHRLLIESLADKLGDLSLSLS